MLNLLLLFWLIILIVSASSFNSTCSSYTCKLPTDYFLLNTCIYYKNSSIIPTYYAAPCYDLNNNYCPPSIKSNSTCTSAPVVQYLRYPGEKCYSVSDCGSYAINCIDQTCTGRLNGEICTGHEYCSPGLRCNSTCIPQLNTGETGCLTDYDCNNYCGCDISLASQSGACIKYWSLKNGDSVKSCINNTNFLCASSTCNGNQCVAGPISSVYPKKCYTNEDCSSNTANIFGTCTCGKNRNANSYCTLFNGDQPYQNYFAILQQWHSSVFVSMCNTIRRFSYICAGDRWDRKQSYYMNYYLYYSNQFPEIIEFDSCIGDVYLSEYLQVKDFLYDINPSTNNGLLISIIMCIGYLMWFLWAFILKCL